MTKPHLADGEGHRVMRYLSYLLEELKLQEWTVLLADAPTEAESDDPPDLAMVTFNNQQHCLTLQLCPDWHRRTDELRTATLLHEMLHIVTRRLWSSTFGYLTRVKPGSLRRHAVHHIQTEEEMLVDRLTGLLLPTLKPYPGPLPMPTPNVRWARDWG